MKWLKYREMWAWGYTKWIYRPLYIDRVTKDISGSIKEEMEELGREHQWSDKFRCVEWGIINTKQVPNKHIEAAYESMKTSISGYRDAVKRLKEKLPLIDKLKGKGRKTCPDEIYRAKLKKLQARSLTQKG